ncbi:MAG: glycosyltransferase family 4 protein, partial [Pseudomonadota bacterium]|nr:glycosyltransferase family 4 protein [Pseudomonadota bacterium]
PWPAGFDSARRREKEWLSYVRGVYKLMPGHRTMLRAAARILVGSRHTEADLPAEVLAKTLYLPENGVDPQRFPPQARGPFAAPLRAVFVGRLVPYKGPDMLLEAAEPLLRSGAMRLDILGDGPMAGELRAWVAQRGLESAVTLHGFVENQRVKDILGSSHVLAFPSVREFGGGVVLEAMAMGVVPLVVDYAGPGELVDAAVGFKVPIGPRAAIVQDFRTRLTALSADPAALAPLSAAARTRVMEQFTWAAKAGQIKAIYEQVVAEAAARRAA